MRFFEFTLKMSVSLDLNLAPTYAKLLNAAAHGLKSVSFPKNSMISNARVKFISPPRAKVSASSTIWTRNRFIIHTPIWPTAFAANKKYETRVTCALFNTWNCFGDALSALPIFVQVMLS